MHLFRRPGPFAPDGKVIGRRLRVSMVHDLPARGLSPLVLGQGLGLLHRAAISSWKLEIDILVIYGFAVRGGWQKERGSEGDGSVLVLR
jgi:hypothetical protein